MNPSTSRFARLFDHRVRALPEPTRTALLLFAFASDPNLDLLRRAWHHHGTDLGALEPAERDALVRVQGERLVFGHPLMRAAVVASSTLAERAAAHVTLAAVSGEDARGSSLSLRCEITEDLPKPRRSCAPSPMMLV